MALISHLGYDVEDIGPFLDAMEAAARRVCVAILLEQPPPTEADRLWPAIHGVERAALPSLPEFIALLLARGKLLEVQLVERSPQSYDEPDQALAWLRGQLWTAPDGPKDQQLQTPDARAHPGAPRPLRDVLGSRAHGHRHLASSRGAARRSTSNFTNSSTGCAPRSPWRRSRTETVPPCWSRSPTTSMYGTCCPCASRILACIFSRRASTSTRNPAARSCAGHRLGVLEVPIGDRHDDHLHRRQPQRKRPGVVLDQHGHESLVRAVNGAMNHHRLVRLAVLADVLQLEALRHLKVELRRVEGT